MISVSTLLFNIDLWFLTDTDIGPGPTELPTPDDTRCVDSKVVLVLRSSSVQRENKSCLCGESAALCSAPTERLCRSKQNKPGQPAGTATNPVKQKYFSDEKVPVHFTL